MSWLEAGDGERRGTEAGASVADAGSEGLRTVEAVYGRRLRKAKERVSRWRRAQAKEAFLIGELWSGLSETLSPKEVSAFLASECQIPRRDVSRYVRLVRTLGDRRDFLIDNGVAVSVLLDLAAQPGEVRHEALNMIAGGRALQAKELRGLRRDVGLAAAAREGRPDTSGLRRLRDAAARRARAEAEAWIASLHELANEVVALWELDRGEEIVHTQGQRLADLASHAARLLAALPGIAGAEFLAPAAEARPAGTFDLPGLNATLKRIADGDVFEEIEHRRPLTTLHCFDERLVWALLRAFGEYPGDAPAAHLGRMRKAGHVPLDIRAEEGRLRADAGRAPSVLEICAGGGGQALGLEAAGFRHAGLVEIDPDAAATLKANRPEWPVIDADLRGLDLRRHEGVDLLAGGVPCQPFSAAGERLGAFDERDLFPEALRLVRELRPKAVMLENVTGALHVSNSVNRLRILSEIASLGYDAEWRILEGPWFGLPQNRRRALLVGFRPGIAHRFRWPARAAEHPRTLGEALRDLMASGGWRHADAWAAQANGLAPTLIGGSQKKKGIDLAQPKSRQSWIRLGVNPNGRAKAAPGPDAPADHMPKLTLRMMARLQDFPDDWEFRGSDQQAFRQIANAFPRCMALAVGTSIMRALTGSEIDLRAALAAPPRPAPRLDLRRLMQRTQGQPEEAGPF